MIIDCKLPPPTKPSPMLPGRCAAYRLPSTTMSLSPTLVHRCICRPSRRLPPAPREDAPDVPRRVHGRLCALQPPRPPLLPHDQGRSAGGSVLGDDGPGGAVAVAPRRGGRREGEEARARGWTPCRTDTVIRVIPCGVARGQYQGSFSARGVIGFQGGLGILEFQGFRGRNRGPEPGGVLLIEARTAILKA